MGERAVMVTTDVSTLTLGIKELEKGNDRLKAILDKNIIGYKSLESKICTSNYVEATSIICFNMSINFAGKGCHIPRS